MYMRTFMHVHICVHTAYVDGRGEEGCSRFDVQNCFSRILDRMTRFSELNAKAAFILTPRVGKTIFRRNWQRSLAVSDICNRYLFHARAWANAYVVVHATDKNCARREKCGFINGLVGSSIRAILPKIQSIYSPLKCYTYNWGGSVGSAVTAIAQ